MFSPAVRLNTQQSNENADSTAIARKPGQSQLLLRKAFQDCPNTPNIKDIITNKRTLSNKVTITTQDTQNNVVVDDLSEQTLPDWSYDCVFNKFTDVEERIPEFGRININTFFKINKNHTPPPMIDDFVFEIPKVADCDYFELPQMDHDLPEPEITQPNFNDFAF